MLEKPLSEGRILIIEDEPGNVRALERLLTREGFQEVLSTTDSREAMELFTLFAPDLVLLDLHMPHMDGFEVMERIGPEVPEDSYLPILVLTGDQDPVTRQQALAVGARDFVTKPFEVTEVLLRIKNLLETRFLHVQLRKQNERLEEKVTERTAELSDARIQILRRLALAAEYRDDVTGQHAERVGILSARLAEVLDLGPERVQLIRRAAPLHDVGKIGIPDAILMKPGKLTPQEFEVMKSHTQIGARILSGSRFPLLQVAETIAAHHHERWDGNGYTPGMAREDIPLVGRLVAVADVFDSLTHARPYKAPLPPTEAVREVVKGKGSHFDPDAVDAFLEVVCSGGVDDLVNMKVSRAVEGRMAAWRIGDEEIEVAAS